MRGLVNLVFWLLPLAGIIGGVSYLPRFLTSMLDSEVPTAVVISRSMWPVLDRGDLILIKGATREEIEVGTILIFRHGAGITIHRVIRLDGDTIVTKGDANNKEDEPITFDDVVGRSPIWFGRPAKIPLVGQIALMMGPQVAVTQDGEEAPKPPGVLQALTIYAKSPVGLAIMLLVPIVMLATALFGQVSSRVRGGRLERLRRLERIRKRWPRARLAH